jgi:hypothetical protein
MFSGGGRGSQSLAFLSLCKELKLKTKKNKIMYQILITKGHEI